MSEAKGSAFGLINLSTWHALEKHAIQFSSDSVSWNQKVAQHVLNFLTEHVKIQPDESVLIACADDNRVLLAKNLAKIFLYYGLSVEVYTTTKLLVAFQDISPIKVGDELSSSSHRVVIDCLTSLDSNKLNTYIASMLTELEKLSIPKIAIDVPAGLNADTGYLRSKQILKVDYTLTTFYSLKGLWTSLAREYVGKIVELDILSDFHISPCFDAYLMQEEQISKLSPKREAFSHKGSFKRVIVIAGDVNMIGASLLSAKAALVMGAGLVEVIVPQGVTPPYGEYPELIWRFVASGFGIEQFIESKDILIVGPGLGEGAWALGVWSVIKNLTNFMVLDASVLEFLASEAKWSPNWIITPHPGEAGKLLKCSNLKIQENRFNAIIKLNKRYASTIVLKGSGTMVLGDKKQGIQICPLGNSGMATPGMGDLLTGFIAGLWAQGLDKNDAAVFGVWLHSKAGDLAALHSMNGIVIASQVLAQIQNGEHNK
jgi:NAD(P)H-hydrate epimerase